MQTVNCKRFLLVFFLLFCDFDIGIVLVLFCFGFYFRSLRIRHQLVFLPSIAPHTRTLNIPGELPLPCPFWPLQQQQVGKVVHRLTPLLVLRSLPRLTVAGCVRRRRASLSWAALRWGFFGLSRHVSVCFALLCFIAAAAALHKLVASASFVMQSTWISSVTDLKIIGRRLKTH